MSNCEQLHLCTEMKSKIGIVDVCRGQLSINFPLKVRSKRDGILDESCL